MDVVSVSLTIAGILTGLILLYFLVYDLTHKGLRWSDTYAYPIVGTVFFCILYIFSWIGVAGYDKFISPPKGRVHVIDLGVVDEIDRHLSFVQFERKSEHSSFTHAIEGVPWLTVDREIYERMTSQFIPGKEYMATYRVCNGEEHLLSFYSKE